MAIHIHYVSGEVSCVSTPLHGLMYWLINQMSQERDDELVLVGDYDGAQLFRSKIRVLNHNNPQLISTAIAAIERRWNKTPVFNSESDPQDQSLEILNWLKEWGDISRLEMT
jgi:hypothetical protein